VNANERDEIIAGLVDQRVDDPDAPRPQGTVDAEWDEAVRLARVARTLRALGEAPPPLAQDRTAAMLGLVPDPSVQLDRANLARLRKAASLRVSDVASRLAERGWDVTTADVFRWESSNADQVPPAMIAAIAAIIGVEEGRLTRAAGAHVVPPGFKSASQRPEFQRLVERLAAIRRVNVPIATSMLQSTALATVKRGSEPDADHWLTILTGYVEALEPGDET